MSENLDFSTIKSISKELFFRIFWGDFKGKFKPDGTELACYFNIRGANWADSKKLRLQFLEIFWNEYPE